MAHCAIVASRSSYCRQLIKITKEKSTSQAPPTTTLNSSLISLSYSTSSPLRILNDSNNLKTISSSTSSILSIEETKASSNAPSFILSQDEFIEIKINGENSEALKLVLEFLYTDRIMSLEGRGKRFGTNFV